jgi:PAS domain S-box-containing protein
MAVQGSIASALSSAAPSEFPWQALLRVVPAVFYVDRSDGTSLWASDNLEQIIGCTFEEWKAGNDAWLARVHPDDRDQVVEEYEEFLRTGHPQSGEYRMILPDGRVRWIHDHALLLADGDTGESLVHGVLVDVTDQRVAREAEERLGQLFRALVEHAREAVTIVDTQGRVVYHNPSMGRVVGQPPEWFAGRSPLELMPPEDALRAKLILEKLQLQSRAQLPGEFRLRHSDGSWRIVEGVATNLLDDPVVHGIILNYRDVTEERAQQKQRESEVEALLNAEAEQRARIAEELHDDTIQVMVAAMVEIDLVERQLRTDRVEEARDTLGLTRDVLAAATERTRRLTFELRPQLLEAAGLQAALRELTLQIADETGAKVELSMAPGRYPHTTEALAYRTIREALINVRKHAHAEHVWVGVTGSEDGLDVEIRDDGRGFRQVSPSPFSKHLGFQMARERIEAAGGRFQIDSRPGEGTTVSFWLPIGQ